MQKQRRKEGFAVCAMFVITPTAMHVVGKADFLTAWFSFELEYFDR